MTSNRYKIGIIIFIFLLIATFGSVLYVSKDVMAADNNGETTAQETTKKAPVVKKIKLKKPKLKIKKRYQKHVKLSWKKVKKAKRYIIYRAKKGKKFVKIKTTKRLKYTDKKAKKRKTYRYKIVATAKSHGKTFKSKPSKKKKVYVRPKNPRIVICGECFVEGMKMYAKKYKPKNSKFVYKIGISTYGLLNTNYIKYGGHTITAVERIAYYNPDRVYFLVGMNEAANKSPQVTARNYKKIFKLLKKINPHIEMVLMALPPVGRSHGSGFANNGSINRYNKAYKRLAKKYRNMFYYSSYRKLITDRSGYLKRSANGGDGGHWSASATIKVVKALKKHSKRLTKR